LTRCNVTLYRYAMASIHRDTSKKTKNWFCRFYDPEGFRRNRSTGTESNKVADMICGGMERASTLARQGKLSNEKALKLIRETRERIEESHGKLPADSAERVLKGTVEEFVKIAGGELAAYTTIAWLDAWLKGHTAATKGTLKEYQRIVELFLKFLGTRADRLLTTLQPVQIEQFKAYLSGRVAPSTVNKSIKVLKAAFSNAVAKRQLEFSPAEHVTSVVSDEDFLRRPFTLDEITKLLKAADAEWKTMILVGFYTGLRLRDCANLNWEKVDLLGGLIDVTPMKTRRNPTSNGTAKKLLIPIADPLLKHLNTLAGDKPDAPICPIFNGKSASWLSGQFYEVMVTAGLVEKRDSKKKGTGKGRDTRRNTNPISFHSLRYNTASAMRSAGVSEAISMDLLGHETEAVHRNYGKTEIQAKRDAVNKLPDISI